MVQHIGLECQRCGFDFYSRHNIFHFHHTHDIRFRVKLQVRVMARLRVRVSLRVDYKVTFMMTQELCQAQGQTLRYGQTQACIQTQGQGQLRVMVRLGIGLGQCQGKAQGLDECACEVRYFGQVLPVDFTGSEQGLIQVGIGMCGGGQFSKARASHVGH